MLLISSTGIRGNQFPSHINQLTLFSLKIYSSFWISDRSDRHCFIGFGCIGFLLSRHDSIPRLFLHPYITVCSEASNSSTPPILKRTEALWLEVLYYGDLQLLQWLKRGEITPMKNLYSSLQNHMHFSFS